MTNDTDIRVTLRQAADRTEAPIIDAVGFNRRVRRHRVRRRAGLATATAAVAAVVLAVPLTLSQIGGESETTRVPVAAGPDSPNPPVYALVGGHTTLIDAEGQQHDLDVRAGVLVGRTSDGVLLVDRKNRLVHLSVTRVGGEWTVERIEPPTVDPVGSVAVSNEGARIAYVDGAGDLVTYDVASRKELDRTRVGASTNVQAYSDRALLQTRSGLQLGVGGGAIELPDGWRASTAGDIVAVPASESVTRLYDVSDGSPTKIEQLPGGLGDLSADGRFYVNAPLEGGDAEIRDLQAQASHPLSGLAGDVSDVRWLDEDTALAVVVADGGGPEETGVLYTCEAATGDCEQVVDVGSRRLELY